MLQISHIFSRVVYNTSLYIAGFPLVRMIQPLINNTTPIIDIHGMNSLFSKELLIVSKLFIASVSTSWYPAYTINMKPTKMSTRPDAFDCILTELERMNLFFE